MPKNIGVSNRAFCHGPSGEVIWHNTFCLWGWSVEDVCTHLWNAVHAYGEPSDGIYWRKLPNLRQINGSTNSDTLGDELSLERVVVYKRPYYIASCRLSVAGKSGDVSAYKPEGIEAVGVGACKQLLDRTQRERNAGVAAAWVHKSWDTGEIYGPAPSESMTRSWHAPINLVVIR